MTGSQAIFDDQIELLANCWERQVHRLCDDELQLLHDHVIAAGLVHELLELVHQSHGDPTASLASSIQNVLEQQNFLDDNGDNVIESAYQARLERAAELCVRILETVRQLALERGHWSNAPNPPQMFG